MKCIKFHSVRCILALLCAFAAASCMAPQQSATAGKPNILVIVADDLGYSDLGSYGGEISTPALDRLAADGAILTRFYTAPTCSPSRSMLFSGTDSHLAGFGNMAEMVADNQRGQPGYEGYLSRRVQTFVERLAQADYHTYLSGKWHQGQALQHGPRHRGFTRSFSLRLGWAHHLSPESYLPLAQSYEYNGQAVTEFDGAFYSTTYYTDKMIEFIAEHQADNRPFFGLLSLTVPHWPLQAPEQWVDKYRGRYDQGYDVIRKARFERMKSLGLLDAELEFPRRSAEVSAWSTLTASDRAFEARKMEIYAAMISHMDAEIQRLFDYLQSIGRFDNTVIVFLSDNGAEGKAIQYGVKNPDNPLAELGARGSLFSPGPGWAQVSVTPLHQWKGFVGEGGIRVPAIVRWPRQITPASRADGLASIMDVGPTLLQMAGIAAKQQAAGGGDLPIRGRSLVPMLTGRVAAVRDEDDSLSWELFGRRAVRQGDWKLSRTEAPHGPGRWALYNLSNDPAEQNDLAAELPARVQSLRTLWDQYVKDTGLILPDGNVGY